MSKGQNFIAPRFEGIINVSAVWSSNTDYDLYAIGLHKDGTEEHVATFGASGIPAKMHSDDYSILHMGDAGRGEGAAGESMQLTFAKDSTLSAVLFVVYSAQSNGTGSFKKYGVEFRADFGDDTVFIPSDKANANDHIYTMAPCWIENTEEGPLMHALKGPYSMGGERRPEFKRTKTTLWGRGNPGDLIVSFDQGPRNDYK